MIKKILYIDVCGGLSGDMLAGALLDLGWPIDELRKLIKRLNLGKISLTKMPVKHQGIVANRLIIKENYDKNYHFRSLSDILKLLSCLPKKIFLQATQVFTYLAQAEAKVHGKESLKNVHFHEVGAIDAIIDVVAFCAGIAWFNVERLICSPLPLGRGHLVCSHGRLPLPSPVVLALLKNAPIYEWPIAEETVTPTGAALVSALAEFAPMPPMHLITTSVGGGSRISTYAPNIVRLLLGQLTNLSSEMQTDEVSELICHIDDMYLEDMPIVFEHLMFAGALDVISVPIIMKKGRSGFMLIVLCPLFLTEEIASLLLKQTTTLGLRLRTTVRRILPRTVVNLNSGWGQVRIKKIWRSGFWHFHPEAEDVARICRETGYAPYEVRRILEELAHSKQKK